MKVYCGAPQIDCKWQHRTKVTDRFQCKWCKTNKDSLDDKCSQAVWL